MSDPDILQQTLDEIGALVGGPFMDNYEIVVRVRRLVGTPSTAVPVPRAMIEKWIEDAKCYRTATLANELKALLESSTP